MHQWLAAPEVAMPAEMRAMWEELNRRVTARMDDEDWRRVALGRQNRLMLVRALHESGAQLLAGSDTPNPSRGAWLCAAGRTEEPRGGRIDAVGCLATSTRDAARFADQLDGRGSVETGQRADLLLEANPLEDVTNVGKLTGVMVHGRWFSRDELTRLLDSVRQPATR